MKGEPLTLEEAYTYLKLLIPSEDANIEHFADSKEQMSTSINFDFLPSVRVKIILTRTMNQTLLNRLSKINVLLYYNTEDILQRFCHGYFGC